MSGVSGGQSVDGGENAAASTGLTRQHAAALGNGGSPLLRRALSPERLHPQLDLQRSHSSPAQSGIYPVVNFLRT